MFGLFRTLVSLAVLLLFILIGATVPIGSHTLFGHIGRIWQSDEAQDLVDSIKNESGPVVERVKRGIKAGVEEAQRPGDAGVDASKSEGAEPEAKEAETETNKAAP